MGICDRLTGVAMASPLAAQHPASRSIGTMRG
jgi:hypothetical protein